MGVGSVWLPIVVWVAMMAICCGGPLLLGRWQRTRRRAQQARSGVMAASADGHKVGSDG